MNGSYCYSHSCSFFSQNPRSIKPGILWSGKQSKLNQPPMSGDTRATAQGLGASPVHFPGQVLLGSPKRRRQSPSGAGSPPAGLPQAQLVSVPGRRLPAGGSAQGRTKMTQGQCRRAQETPLTVATLQAGTHLPKGNCSALGAHPGVGTRCRVRLLEDLKQQAHSQLTKNLPGPRPRAGSPRGLSRTLEGPFLCGWNWASQRREPPTLGPGLAWVLGEARSRRHPSNV